MHTLEITLQRKADTGWPVVVEHRQDNSLPIRREGLLSLEETTRTELASQEYNPPAYGAILGQALFCDSVRDAFMQARITSAECVHLLLVVEAPDLQALRWERLSAPARQGEGWSLLAGDQRVLFSRYLPSRTDRSFPAIGRLDLRALILVADPPKPNEYNLAPFDAAATVKSVKDALGEIPATVLANVEGAVGPPTLNALCDQITGNHYTLLHLVAHGQFRSRDKETLLYFLDTNGQVSPVTATRLLERLNPLHGLPYLAFLSTCESAVAEAESAEALGGLAQRLVREIGMPAVVAMTDKVTIATASALAQKFYVRLRKHGEADRALAEAGAALEDARDSLVPALYSRLEGRPLFSDTEGRELTNTELAYAVQRLDTLIPERAPVLQETYTRGATVLRNTFGVEPAALSALARQERDQALGALNALCDEVLDRNLRALALAQTLPAYDPRCPFPGMAAFQADDREFFFGREALVMHLVQRVQAHPFLAVLGGSGSGKSSLVRAGLVPALQAQHSELQAFFMTPGKDPVARLERILPARVPERTPPAVLVVDQCEELFTLCPVPTRQQFVNRLLALLRDTPDAGHGPGLTVVLTMRADFLGECTPYPQLKAAIQAHLELLAPMTTAELRSAMEQQAARVGLRFEADLSHTMLAEVQDEPGAMPLLQHLLQELWKRRHGRWLLTAEYHALGGIKQAIAHTADALYNALATPAEQASMRNLFVRLTHLGDEPGADQGYRDTRRRVLLADVILVGEEAGTTRRLVTRCADHRLVVTSMSEVTDHEEVEVAHEALIRYWPRLRTWLDEDREFLLWRQRLRVALAEYQRTNRSEDVLLRGAPLTEAERWKRERYDDLNPAEGSFIKESITLRERQRVARERLRRRIMGGLVGGAVVALMLAGLATWQWQSAERGRIEATAITTTNTLLNYPLQGMVSAISLVGQSRSPFLNFINQSLPHSILETLFSAVEISRESNLLKHGQGPVNSVAISTDGQTILSGGGDGTVRMWDRKGQPLAQPFKGQQGPVESVAISTDGQTIVSGGGDGDGTVRVWDRKGQPLAQPFKGHEDGVRSVAISADGQTIVSGGYDGTVRVWDRKGQPLAQPFKDHQGTSFKITEQSLENLRSEDVPDDVLKKLEGIKDQEVMGEEKFITSLKDTIGEERTVQYVSSILKHAHQGAVWSVAISADGQTIVSGGINDGTVRIWDRKGQLLAQPFKGQQGTVFSVAISTDGQTIVSGSGDGTVRVWDRKGQPLAQPFKGHQGYVRSVAISTDGQTIVSGGDDDTVRIWDRKGQPLAQPFKGHQGYVRSVAISADGQTIVSGGYYDDTVRIWDRKGQPSAQLFNDHQGTSFKITKQSLENLRSEDVPDDVLKKLEGIKDQEVMGEEKFITSLKDTIGEERTVQYVSSILKHAHQGGVRSVAISADGQTILSGGYDGTVRIWDRKGQPLAQPFKGQQGGVWSVAISADGQTILSGGYDGTVRIWDRKGQPLAQPFKGHQGGVGSVAISADGQTIVSGGLNDDTVRIWDRKGQPLAQPFKGHQGVVGSVAISADGQTIVSGGLNDHTVRIWGRKGQPLAQPIEHKIGGPLYSVAISANGQTIVSGGYDGTVRIWDRKGQPLAQPFKGHQFEVQCLAISADGLTIVSGGDDGTVRIWGRKGQPLAQPLKGHQGVVGSVAISADGQTIVSGGDDGTVRMWDIKFDTWLKAACERLRDHPVFKKPESADEKKAQETCEPYLR